MSESIVKEEFGVTFAKSISLYNIENINNSNKLVELKHNNENGTKPENITYHREVFHNSTDGQFGVKVTKEMDGDEEPMQIQDVEMKCKEELEIKEEPIAFTEGNYHCSQGDKTFKYNSPPIKHQSAYTGKKPYQCSQCDKAFSQNSSLSRHHRTHTVKKPFQCSQCDKAFSNKNNLINHQR
ncbi:unnamed protein product, partial [Meganyctiphanes norvegica]